MNKEQRTQGSENLPLCPFKRSGELCDTNCPAHRHTQKADEIDSARAIFIAGRDRPIDAAGSKYVEQKFDVPYRKQLFEARKKCHRLNPIERTIGRLQDIRDFKRKR